MTTTTTPTNSTESSTLTGDRARALVADLESAWNVADGDGFAAPFADDAVFVNVRGERIRGRHAIAAGHHGIFTTIYRDSTVRYALDAVQPLGPGVSAVHVDADLDVPGGPLAGAHRARFTMVVTEAAGEWTIAAFHNTTVVG